MSAYPSEKFMVSGRASILPKKSYKRRPNSTS
jgi:hypothetical protein